MERIKLFTVSSLLVKSLAHQFTELTDLVPTLSLISSSLAEEQLTLLLKLSSLAKLKENFPRMLVSRPLLTLTNSDTPRELSPPLRSD